MNAKLLEWKCIGCNFFLGFIEDKKIIRIKRKDLYVEVEGGKVTETCPRCGKRNTIADENFKEASGGPT